jgi:hypothetical protein
MNRFKILTGMLVNHKYFKKIDNIYYQFVERVPVEYLQAMCPVTPLTPTETNGPLSCYC